MNIESAEIYRENYRTATRSFLVERVRSSLGYMIKTDPEALERAQSKVWNLRVQDPKAFQDLANQEPSRAMFFPPEEEGLTSAVLNMRDEILKAAGLPVD